MRYTLARLQELSDIEDRLCTQPISWKRQQDMLATGELIASCDYLDEAVDHVPGNLDEALELFAIGAAELNMDFGPILRLTKREGKTLDALIELRRLLRVHEAYDLEDPDGPHWETRLSRSLIAWMARPFTHQN